MNRLIWVAFVSVGLFVFAGCGGGNNPVNEGKDVPVKKKDK